MIKTRLLRGVLPIGYGILALALDLLLLTAIDRVGAEVGVFWMRFPRHSSPEWHKWSYIILAGLTLRVVFDSIDRIVAKFREQRK